MNKEVIKEMVKDIEKTDLYIPDTSVIIEGILSHLIDNKKFKGKISGKEANQILQKLLNINKK